MLAAQHCVCTKSSLKNEHTTRDVHVWRGGESTKDKIFFLMMMLEQYKRKGVPSGCTWQLFAVAKS